MIKSDEIRCSNWLSSWTSFVLNILMTAFISNVIFLLMTHLYFLLSMTSIFHIMNEIAISKIGRNREGIRNSPQYLSDYLKRNSNNVYNIKLLTKLLQILLERELENLRTLFFHFTFLSGTN